MTAHARGAARCAAVVIALAVAGLMTASAATAAESGAPSDDASCTTYYPSPSDSGVASATGAPTDSPSAPDQSTGRPTDQPTDVGSVSAIASVSASDSGTPTDVPSNTDAPTDRPPSGPVTACVAGVAAAGGPSRSSDPLARTGSQSAEFLALAVLLITAGVGLSLLGGRAASRRPRSSSRTGRHAYLD